MKNPFDPHEQPNEFNFFKEMTYAINDWMLKKYPSFTEDLEYRIQKTKEVQEELKKYQDKILTSFHNHNQTVLKDKEVTLEYFKTEIKRFLAEDYPDMSGKLSQIAEKLEHTLKKHDKNYEKIEKNIEKIIDSGSLYEDVYKMRDDMKILQKSVDGFTKKLKKVFE